MAKRKVETPEWVDQIRRQDEDGKEIVDAKPVAIPAGFRRPETLAEQVRRLVRMEQMEDTGEETWEDANDFDVDDDFDPRSPWETIYDEALGREVTPAEFHSKWPEIREEMQKKLRNHYRLLEQQEQQEELFRRQPERKKDPDKGGPSPAEPGVEGG